MKTKATLAAIAVLMIFPSNIKAQKEVIYCGDDKAKIVNVENIKDGKTDVVWQWSIDEAKDQIPQKYHRYFAVLDECKPVDNNKKVLITSSADGVALIDRKTKKCLFYAYVPMAHSAELLPGNVVAVALSTNPKGNSVELYNIKESDVKVFRDTLYSGHGVVWMKKQKRLYALGYNELREYIYVNKKGENPSLKLDKSYKVPLDGGHDLSKINDNELLVTVHKGVLSFDVRTGSFKPFEPLRDTPNVKSVNMNKKSGKIVYTKGEISWWTHNIYFFNSDYKIVDDNINIYKCRVSKW